MRSIVGVGGIILIMFLGACGVSSPEELWASAENNVNSRQYLSAVATLEKLSTTYPDSPLAPQAQFLMGDIYMNRMSDMDRALEAYKIVVENYPDHQDAVKALFMTGFVKANYLEDHEGASLAYNLFLERYPDHELVSSVKFELTYLGRPIEDIETLRDIINGK